jgi:hypothetical protein
MSEKPVEARRCEAPNPVPGKRGARTCGLMGQEQFILSFSAFLAYPRTPAIAGR